MRKIAVFASHARQQASPDSAIDVAVILDALESRRYAKRRRMADPTYEIMPATGMDIRARPGMAAEWSGSDEHSDRDLFGNMKRDDVEFEVPPGA